MKKLYHTTQSFTNRQNLAIQRLWPRLKVCGKKLLYLRAKRCSPLSISLPPKTLTGTLQGPAFPLRNPERRAFWLRDLFVTLCGSAVGANAKKKRWSYNFTTCWKKKTRWLSSTKKSHFYSMRLLWFHTRLFSMQLFFVVANHSLRSYVTVFLFILTLVYSNSLVWYHMRHRHRWYIRW